MPAVSTLIRRLPPALDGFRVLSGESTTVPRANYLTRCVRCRMHISLCVCAHIPRIDTVTRVCVVSHKREVRKASNTTHFILKALPNSEQWRRGDLSDPPIVLPLDQPTLLLFPYDDADELTPDMARPGLNLIVPDGTWQQARRIHRREQGLQHLRCVRLPPGAPSEYRIRTQHRSDGVSTFEAIARALGILEDPTIESRLVGLFKHIVANMGRDPSLGIPPPAEGNDANSRTLSP